MRNSAGNLARLTAISLALGALASCASLREEGITAGPEGGAYIVTGGTPLVVSLPIDPDSDFRWELVGKSNAQLWLIGGPDYTTLPKPDYTLGIGGMSTFRFRARDAGTTTLEFAYRRPQEQGVAPAKVAKFDVTVQPFVWQDIFKDPAGPKPVTVTGVALPTQVAVK